MSSKDLSYNVDYSKSLKLDAKSAFSLIDSLVGHYKEMKIAIEREETLREEIRANKEIEIARIQNTTRIILDYLERSYDERKFQFENYFNLIDKALGKNDINALNVLVTGVIELSKSSPFKDIVNVAKVQKDLEDPDKVWEF